MSEDQSKDPLDEHIDALLVDTAHTPNAPLAEMVAAAVGHVRDRLRALETALRQPGRGFFGEPTPPVLGPPPARDTEREVEAADRYRKRPIVVSAIRWFPGKKVDGVVESPVLEPRDGNPSGVYGQIRTLEGWLTCDPGDWIITGIKGERYPCKPDIVALTYQPVERQAAETQVFVGTARRREVGDLLKEALIKERDDYRARAIAAEEALAELTAEAKTAWSFIRLYEQAPHKYRAAHADALWKAIEAAAAVATAKQSAPTVETRAFHGDAVEHTNGISSPWWCIDETCDANWFMGLDGARVRLTSEVLEKPAARKDDGS